MFDLNLNFIILLTLTLYFILCFFCVSLKNQWSLFFGLFYQLIDLILGCSKGKIILTEQLRKGCFLLTQFLKFQTAVFDRVSFTKTKMLVF